MKIIKQLVCPVSEARISERVTRLNAFFALFLIGGGFIFNSIFFLIFLLADFYIRAFTNLKYSPISYISSKISNVLNLNKKEVGKAQKIFAARLGFIMTLGIVVLFAFELSFAAMIVAGILVFFTTLEFTLAICVGCIIYTYLVLPFYN